MAKKILVIDDDEDLLNVFEMILTDEGYEIFPFTSGKTIDQIINLHPDLIILDVRILGFTKSGSELCADIKKQIKLKEIPVLLVSAEENLATIAGNCRANGYIRKPFEIDKLLAKVKEFIT